MISVHLGVRGSSGPLVVVTASAGLLAHTVYLYFVHAYSVYVKHQPI